MGHQQSEGKPESTSETSKRQDVRFLPRQPVAQFLELGHEQENRAESSQHRRQVQAKQLNIIHKHNIVG